MPLVILDIGPPSPKQLHMVIRGMRNSWESWKKGDSNITPSGNFSLGENDMRLMKQLIKGGTDHAKAMRQIPVIIDVRAPDYFWRQFDQYVAGVIPTDITTNSTSQMHTLGRERVTEQHIDLEDVPLDECERYLEMVEVARQRWLEAGKRKGPMAKAWRGLLQLISTGWLYERTVSTNYQALRAMYHARRHHRELEWRQWCAAMEQLPLYELIIWSPQDDEQPKKQEEPNATGN